MRMLALALVLLGSTLPTSRADGQSSPGKAVPCGTRMTKHECAEMNMTTRCDGVRVKGLDYVDVKCTVENNSAGFAKSLRLECTQFDAAGRPLKKGALRSIPAVVRPGEKTGLPSFKVEHVVERTATVHCSVDGVGFADR